MSDKIDLEIEAIKTILKTLEGLDDEVRKNVMEYVLKRTGLTTTVGAGQETSSSSNGSQERNNNNGEPEQVQHIKQFKETKAPKSALEMAVVIAYYLQYVAEEDKRKDRVGTSDLQTWFRIADFPLPTGDMRYVLNNAKNAGYLDSVGNGEYKLNAIGYNLVKHNLPRQDSNGQKRRSNSTPRKTQKSASKKAAPKKAAKKSSKK